MARKKDKHKEEDEMGWDKEDKDEAKQAEKLKGTDLDVGKVSYHDDDGVIETYDEDTGKMEGKIVLKDGNEEGLLTIVKIAENVDIEQDHMANPTKISFNGQFSVHNPSTVDRLWDIDILLKNKQFTNLKSEAIKIRELGVKDDDNTYTEDFQLAQDAKNLLIVKEYVNTLENADDILNLNDIERDLDNLSQKTGATEAGPAKEAVKKPADKAVPAGEKDLKTEYEALTVAELKDLCEQRGIEVPGGAKKGDIINLLLNDEDGIKVDDDDEDYDGAAAEEVSLESFGISISKLNTVTFVVAMKSFFETPVTNLKITKTIPAEFENVIIVDTSVGMAEMEGSQIIWSIDELEPKIPVILKFRADITVETHDPVKTGVLEVIYTAASSFAGGFGVEKFDAYTRNRFYVDILERDEEPGVWDCSLVFENSSEFIIQLFNADVYAPENQAKKLVDIDPNDVPLLPAGAKWMSTGWVTQNEDYPTFRKKLEFRVMPDFQTEVNSIIKISDVELGLASITGSLTYDVAKIELPIEEEEGVTYVPTYKKTDINADLKAENNGSMPLDKLKITHKPFSDQFQPPSLEETKDEDGNVVPPEVQVLKNGKPVKIQPGDLRVEDNALIYDVDDLKNRPEGPFNPEDVYEVKYPVHAVNPVEGSEFDSDVLINANTDPRGPELEFQPIPDEVPVIKAIHLRRRYRLGKDIIPIGALGEYQIVISLENVGTTNMPLKNFVIMDKVPDSFNRSKFTMEPEVTDLKGEDILKWTVEQLNEGEKLEITYNIKGTGEYNPSQAQVAF